MESVYKALEKVQDEWAKVFGMEVKDTEALVNYILIDALRGNTDDLCETLVKMLEPVNMDAITLEDYLHHVVEEKVNHPTDETLRKYGLK